MESKIIKSKHINDGIVEIFEFSDMSGDVVSYLVTKAYKGQTVSGSGAARIEEVSFSNKEGAITFFNNQN